MLIGDTSPAGHVIGPPQPTPTPPTARRSGHTWSSSASTVRQIVSASTVGPAGVGTRVGAWTRPPGSTSAAASFVPPMSRASTARRPREPLLATGGPPTDGPPTGGPPADGPPADGPPADGPPAEGDRGEVAAADAGPVA